jgi:hypothetical protein
MPLIPFPDIPQVPGVPALAREAVLPSIGAVINMGLGALAESIFGNVVWAIKSADGGDDFVPDSFVSIEQRSTSRVANYPMEAGSFASYNKVQMPYDCRVRVAISSDLATRQRLLQQLDSMKQSTALFNVISPEATYTNATLQEYSYRRESSSGVTLIQADLWFVEIRQTAQALFNSTQQPESADPASTGTVQPVEVATASPVASYGQINATNLPPLT